MYKLSIFASSIQTIKNNITRFVILNKEGNLISNENINKAALKFILDHQRGSLAAILNVMSDCQLNLTKIQSLPVIETPGKYAFFVDVTFEEFELLKSKKLISIMASEFKILGNLPASKMKTAKRLNNIKDIFLKKAERSRRNDKGRKTNN